MKKILHARYKIEARLNIVILQQICRVLPHEMDSSVADEKSRSANLGSIRSGLHQKVNCLMPSFEKAGHAKIDKKVVLDSSLCNNE